MRDYDVICSKIFYDLKIVYFFIKASSTLVARSRILLKIDAL